jgi:hypothetical protein
MSVSLTEENFARHLHTSFRVRAPRPVELELHEVKGWQARANEQTGLERFSVFFTGPGDIFLPQQIYTLEHEQMGVFEIFLVPIGRDAQGFRYEAVFNYYK